MRQSIWVDEVATCQSDRRRIRSGTIGGAVVKLFDISLSLSPQTIHWVTGTPLQLIERKRMSRGDTNNSSSVHTSVHAGTHVDAPFHFVPNGVTIEALPLDLFIGPCSVCELQPGSHITAADINKL